jgi:hypothetical protein
MVSPELPAAEKSGYKYRSKLIKDREDFNGFYHLFDIRSVFYGILTVLDRSNLVIPANGLTFAVL